MAPGVELWHRDRLDGRSACCRTIDGVTVLIYDQHCAADAHGGNASEALPARTRVLINEAVCEGCGDCGIKGNCLSVQPVDTSSVRDPSTIVPQHRLFLSRRGLPVVRDGDSPGAARHRPPVLAPPRSATLSCRWCP